MEIEDCIGIGNANLSGAGWFTFAAGRTGWVKQIVNQPPARMEPVSEVDRKIKAGIYIEK